MQSQITDLFKDVLDIDTGTDVVPQRMAAYYTAAGEGAFRFYPQSVSFELVNQEVFTEVLEPGSMYDLIAYHLRECVKRGGGDAGVQKLRKIFCYDGPRYGRVLQPPL